MASETASIDALSHYLQYVGLWKEAWEFFLDPSLPDWTTCASVRLHIEDAKGEGTPLHGFVFCQALLASGSKTAGSTGQAARWQQLFLNALYNLYIEGDGSELGDSDRAALRELFYTVAGVSIDEPELLSMEEAMGMYQQASWAGCR